MTANPRRDVSDACRRILDAVGPLRDFFHSPAATHLPRVPERVFLDVAATACPAADVVAGELTALATLLRQLVDDPAAANVTAYRAAQRIRFDKFTQETIYATQSR